MWCRRRHSLVAVAVAIAAAVVGATVTLGAGAAVAAGKRPGRCGPLSAARVAGALDRLLEAVRGSLPTGAEVSAVDVTVRGCGRLPSRVARLVVVPSLGSRVGRHANAVLRLVDADGRPAGRAYLRAELAVRVPTVVAAQTLPGGETLRRSDLTVALVARDRVPARALERPEDAVGLRLRRPVPEGEPLRSSLLERPMLVRRGALVEAIVTRGDLVVTSRGLAQEDGRLGDTIRLESPNGERAFLARVVGPNRVEVQ